MRFFSRGGSLEIRNSLAEPTHLSIRYALNSKAQITNYCVSGMNRAGEFALWFCVLFQCKLIRDCSLVSKGREKRQKTKTECIINQKIKLNRLHYIVSGMPSSK